MAKVTKFNLIGILFWCLLGAVSAASGKKHEYVEAQALKSSRDVEVPKDVVAHIEKLYLAEFHRQHSVTSMTDVEIVAEIKRQLLDLEVTMEPAGGEALAEGLRFALPTGGGVIDLADHVKKPRGSYLVRMKVKQSIAGGQLHVFYIPGARGRKIGNEEFGAGCDNWSDLTTWFQNSHLREPLEVYATDQRDISVLGGIWLFAILAAPELYLGTISYTDRRFPHILCPSRSNL